MRKRCTEGDYSRLQLNRFLDTPGSEAAGTDTDSLGGTVDQRTHSLEVRHEDAFGLVVGMADIVPSLMFLPAHFTRVGHRCDSFSRTLALYLSN